MMRVFSATAYTIGALPWCVALPILADVLGRKRPFLLVGIDGAGGFLFCYYSTNVQQLFLGLILLGAINGSLASITLLIGTEYSSPRYRGIFLTVKSASFAWGIWVSNTIGTFFQWKNICLVGVVTSVYIVVSAAFWPESPYWLMTKDRLDEGAAAHHWIKGTDNDSEKELLQLIESQSMKIATKIRTTKKIWPSVKYNLRRMSSKEFFMPVVLGALTYGFYHLSGKMVSNVYSIDILRKITASESAAYTGMLVLDGIAVVSMYFGCGLSKYLRRRTLLFVGASTAVAFMCCLSLYLYLISWETITENYYISIWLLIGYTLALGCGPTIVATSICAELLPIKLRSFALIMISMSGNILMFTVLKIYPSLSKAFKLHGTFLFFAISTVICLAILYFYLPETKDKTMQEIRDSFREIPRSLDIKNKEKLFVTED